VVVLPAVAFTEHADFTTCTFAVGGLTSANLYERPGHSFRASRASAQSKAVSAAT